MAQRTQGCRGVRLRPSGHPLAVWTFVHGVRRSALLAQAMRNFIDLRLLSIHQAVQLLPYQLIRPPAGFRRFLATPRYPLVLFFAIVWDNMISTQVPSI